MQETLTDEKPSVFIGNDDYAITLSPRADLSDAELEKVFEMLGETLLNLPTPASRNQCRQSECHYRDE